MNKEVIISPIIEKMICPGKIDEIYISEDDLYLVVEVTGANGLKYSFIAENAWRVIDKKRDMVVLGEYDEYYLPIEDMNKILKLMVNHNNSVKDCINAVKINIIGSLILYTDEIIIESFVSGCGNITNWKIDDKEKENSICIMTSKELYFDPQIVTDIS